MLEQCHGWQPRRLGGSHHLVVVVVEVLVFNALNPGVLSPQKENENAQLEQL
jgi:hypothetical protein